MFDDDDIEYIDLTGDDSSAASDQDQSIVTTGGGQRKMSVSDRVDQVREGVNDVGKTIEGVGKIEVKAGEILQGGSKASDAVDTVGSGAASGVKTAAGAVDKAADVQKAGAAATKAGAESVKAGAEGVKAGATTAKAGSEAVTAAGEVINAAGTAADSAYGAGVAANVVGTAMTAAGKVGDAASTATIAGSEAAIAGATATEAAADAANKAADIEKAAAKGTGAAADATKKGLEAKKNANKASNELADKLEKSGRRHIEVGKKIQKASDNIDSEKVVDNFTDKLGKGGQYLGSAIKGFLKLFDIRTIAVFTLLFTIVASLFVSYILSPMFYMKVIKDTVLDPDRIEKVQNYLSGLGFKDSEEAFYDEVDYLNAHYKNELDFPYVMAALYYVEISYGKKDAFYFSDNPRICGNTSGQACDAMQLGYQIAKNYLEEANSTVGGDGLVYSTNKLYRLRALAKNQFIKDRKGDPKEKTLKEYIQTCIDSLSEEVKSIKEYFPLFLCYIIAYLLGWGDVANTILVGIEALNAETKYITDTIKIFEGTETWGSIKLYFEQGKYLSGVYKLFEFFSTYFDCFFNVKRIYLDKEKIINDFLPDCNECDCADDDEECKNECEEKQNDQSCLCEDGDEDCTGYTFLDVLFIFFEIMLFQPFQIIDYIKVEYWDYKYSEVQFEDYLVEHYIPEMPEFQDVLKNLSGEKREARIKIIAKEIKLLKEAFDEIYDLNETAQELNDCNGDIKLDLLAELTPPVNLTMGQTVTFSGTNNYGLLKGVLHNGVDLEPESTGTHAGDQVYSVYDGVVVSSTADGTFPDKTVNGGWAVIEYAVQYKTKIGNAGTEFKSNISKIRLFYGGLDPTSFSLRQGETVTKGQVIGYVGGASASENGEQGSLHIGVYDLKKDIFLNPVNMFITCKTKNKGKGGSGSGGGSSGGYNGYGEDVCGNSKLQIHSTSLTRQEFIDATQAYIDSGGQSSDILSTMDLGELYDSAEDNNVNPEYAVSRAIIERHTEHGYNYWSIGCYNTNPQCAYYDTVSDAMAGFGNVISDYVDLYDTKKYQSIGDYWYNPGDWGAGGCIYLSAEESWLSDERRDEIQSYCDLPDGSCMPYYESEGECLATNDEDEVAHLQYNCKLLDNYFEIIYGSYY